MEVALKLADDGYHCRRHPSLRRHGVCPHCLREHLLRLCPECATPRPCGCHPSSPASSSSSFSSFSSASDLATRHGAGAVGRVGQLIDEEPAFRRSRSTALSFARWKPDAPRAPQPKKPLRWNNFLRFPKPAPEPEPARSSGASAVEISRSKSVCVERYRIDVEERPTRGWGWHLLSPMKVFRHRKSVTVGGEP